MGSGRHGLLRALKRWPKGVDVSALPDQWKNVNGDVKDNYADRVPRPVMVRPDGSVPDDAGNGEKMFFIPLPFAFCPECQATYVSHLE